MFGKEPCMTNSLLLLRLRQEAAINSTTRTSLSLRLRSASNGKHGSENAENGNSGRRSNAHRNSGHMPVLIRLMLASGMSRYQALRENDLHTYERVRNHHAVRLPRVMLKLKPHQLRCHKMKCPKPRLGVRRDHMLRSRSQTSQSKSENGLPADMKTSQRRRRQEVGASNHVIRPEDRRKLTSPQELRTLLTSTQKSLRLVSSGLKLAMRTNFSQEAGQKYRQMAVPTITITAVTWRTATHLAWSASSWANMKA